MENLLSQPIASNFKAPDPIPPEPGVLVMGPNGVDGVSRPSCITCPDPGYTEAARSGKFGGTLILSAVIATNGEVSSVYVVKPLPFGLTQRAIATVRNWKFKPAMKDGNPVPARVNITITFRLL